MTEPDSPGISSNSDEIDIRSIAAANRPARPWALITGCVALCLLLVLFAEFLIRDWRNREIQAQSERLEAVAILKASLVESWLAVCIGDAEVSARGVATTMLPLWELEPTVPEARALAGRLEFLRRASDYVKVEVTDLAGRVILAAPDPAENARLAFALPAIAELGRPHFVWLNEGVDHPGWSFALAQPLSRSEQDTPRGWLVLTVDPTNPVEELLSEWPGNRRTAETVLLRRDERGAWYYPSEVDDAAAARASAAGPGSDPLAASVLRGASGRLETHDASGEEVLAHLVPIAGLPWVLGTKMDHAEVHSRLASRERLVRGSLVTVVVLAIVLAGLALRQNRRRFESRAAQANQRFKALFGYAEEGVLLLDRKARLIDINPFAREMLKADASMPLGLPFTDLLAPGDVTSQPLKLGELAERGTVRTERRLRRLDGEEFPSALHSIRFPDGRILTFVRDLSAARRAEERERRAKRMALFGTWDWDPRTDVTHWDDETYFVLGYDPATDVASREAWFERVHEEDRERIAEGLSRALADEAVLDFEHRLSLPNGLERNVRILGDIVRSESGTAQRIDGCIQDVTAQRFADAKLASAQQQLAEAQKTEAVGRLAGSIAHDFNNVVGVISGFAELAELELDEASPTRQHLVEIRQGAKRAAELTRQLLAFARRKPSELRVVPFAEIAADVEGPLRQILGGNIELELGGNCEGASLRADPAQIVQLILNLAVNARDSMPGGGSFSIRWRRVELPPAFVNRHPPLRTGRCLELTIEDTGVGMDAATLARCFEPFFTTKGQGVGTGLGLSSVKSALDNCGAAVEVESEVGRGTKFTIWFPVVIEEAARTPAESAAAPLGRDEHVLVVDDVAPMREMVGNILTRAGFRVTLSADAESALERLSSTERAFDLLLTDVVMPKVSGRELAERACVAQPDLRVLFMTGHAGLQPDGMPFELPESLLIEKPFTGSELVRRIRASLDAPPESPPSFS